MNQNPFRCLISLICFIFTYLFTQYCVTSNECLIDRKKKLCVRAGIGFKMLFGFVTYVRNRGFGSPYPSINARPSTKALKTEKKIRAYLMGKLIKFVNALPLPRYTDSVITGNTIEMKGTCQHPMCKRARYLIARHIATVL